MVELKEFVTISPPKSLDYSVDEIGYVVSGHGAKGKECWLHTDADIKEMYEQHKVKKEILLWCYSEKPKHEKLASAVNGGTHASVYNNHTKKMSEVDEILSKLDEKHHGHYSPEQMRAWAHMIHMSKHDSYDEPPNKPFFEVRNGPALRLHLNQAENKQL